MSYSNHKYFRVLFFSNWHVYCLLILSGTDPLQDVRDFLASKIALNNPSERVGLKVTRKKVYSIGRRIIGFSCNPGELSPVYQSASADADYERGVAIFTMTKRGLMLQASVSLSTIKWRLRHAKWI
jgi:hypothetical protein